MERLRLDGQSRFFTVATHMPRNSCEGAAGERPGAERRTSAATAA
jgi:hypothetical protein